MFGFFLGYLKDSIFFPRIAKFLGYYLNNSRRCLFHGYCLDSNLENYEFIDTVSVSFWPTMLQFQNLNPHMLLKHEDFWYSIYRWLYLQFPFLTLNLIWTLSLCLNIFCICFSCPVNIQQLLTLLSSILINIVKDNFQFFKILSRIFPFLMLKV